MVLIKQLCQGDTKDVQNKDPPYWMSMFKPSV